MTLRTTAFLLGILAVLFMACWGANRVETLQRHRTSLQRELEYQRDESLRLMAAWLKATERHQIVPRATIELALVEPEASEHEIVVLAPPHSGSDDHPVLEYLARAFDRYGNIDDAQAKEER